MNKDIIRSVIDRVLWTAGATEWNRDLLADAISKALAAAPQVAADERALFSDWLATTPLPVQENIKASMARGESYTYKAFCDAVALAANHAGSTKIEGATFICDGAANPVSYSGPNGKMAIDLRGWTCYAPGAAPVQAQEPKSFAGPGAWFSVDALGNPMREYSPGKWENCVWPSVAPVQPVAVPDGWQATDDEIAAWNTRHDLRISSATDRRAVFEDAQTLRPQLAAPAAQGKNTFMNCSATTDVIPNLLANNFNSSPARKTGPDYTLADFLRFYPDDGGEMYQDPYGDFIYFRDAENLIEQIQAAQGDAKDAERLRWLAETGARISWSMDGEYCAVWLHDERDGTESRPAEDYPLKCYDSWHRAIDAAIAAKAAS